MTGMTVEEGLSVKENGSLNCPLCVELPSKIQLPEQKKDSVSIYNIDSISSRSSKGKLYFVPIGIGNYPINSKLPCLKSTSKSIEEFNQIFKKYKIQFNQLYDSIFHLEPSLRDSLATKNNIVNYLYQILQKAQNNDLIIIYLYGHGIIPDQSEMFYFLPYDADLTEAFPFL
jgi:hypothetical protein